MGERDLVPGDVLDKYRLERLLGRGGMGEVWAAHDPDLDRRIALKVLNRALAGDEDAQARLQREGRAMARLRHPNVITVHDALFRAGRGLIAMELIDGESLATWLIRRRSPEELMRVLLAAGHGLAAAHRAGMVHRDFKPHNVLVERDGRVIVTDFGLARASGDTIPPAPPPAPPVAIDTTAATLSASASSGATPVTSGWAAIDAGAETIDRAKLETLETGISPAPQTPPQSGGGGSGDLGTPLTQTGALLGTPAYMAPEQLAGQPADARADQFAFCVTVWEAFAGERPFRGKTIEELAAAVKAGVPDRTDRVPRRLRPLLARGLARDPFDRWPGMDALLDALARAWRRPKRIAIAAIAATVIAGVALAFVLATGHKSPIEGCGDADAALAPAWSPAIRDDVAVRLATTPGRDRVVRFFDRWGESWKTARHLNCKRTSDPEFSARRICLESIRDEVAMVTELRTTARPDVFADQERYLFIPFPDDCMRDPRALGPSPPAPDKRDDVARLRGDLANAYVDLMSPTIDTAEVDVASLVDRAARTGYEPVIAEVGMTSAIQQMYLHPDADNLCAGVAAAVDHADAIGYERLAVESLFTLRECVAAARGDPAPILRRLDAVATRTGHPLVRAAVDALLADAAYLRGELDLAVTLIGTARTGYDAYELSRWSERAMLAEAQYRLDRARDGDLATAAELVDKLAQPLDPTLSPDEVARLRFRIAWWNRAAVLPPAPDDAREDMPSNLVTITVTVTDGGLPVAGAQVGASYELHVDATRIGMREAGVAASGTTDAAGKVELTVGESWMVYARMGDRAGYAVVPKHGGAATIALAPTASVAGTINGLARQADPKPDDPVARFVVRSEAVALLHHDVADHIITFEAPVDGTGHWHLDGLLPGDYLVSVQARSFGNDFQARQAQITVAAGRTELPEQDFDLAPSVLEVVREDSDPTDYVLAFDADRLPMTWDQLGELLMTRTALTRAYFLPQRATDKLLPGQRVARLAVRKSGTVACRMPGISVFPHQALSRFFASIYDAPQCAMFVLRDPVTRWEPDKK